MNVPVRADRPFPDAPELSDAQRRLIERIGVLHDGLGVRPAAGRILALFLVSPEEQLTFDQVRMSLALSKGATSASLQHLQDIGSVEYTTRPGERRRYFRKRTENWDEEFFARMVGYYRIRDMLKEAQELAPASGEAGRVKEQMIDFLGLMEEAVHEGMRRWRARESSSPNRENEL